MIAMSPNEAHNQPNPKETFKTMLKMKLLVGLVGLLTALFVMAAPATAEFVSNGPQGGQGKIKSFPSTTTFVANKESPPITCKSASGEPAGEWHIQQKTQLIQGKYLYQPQTKKGPHESLKITKWGTCAALGIGAQVTCNLQVEQGTQNGSTGSVYPPGCTVKVGTGENTCTVNVQPDGNKELREVKLKNGGQNEVEINSEVKGVTSTIQESKELCKTLGVKGGQGTGEFKTEGALITQGQKLE
jgi:hypothetical protein